MGQIGRPSRNSARPKWNSSRTTCVLSIHDLAVVPVEIDAIDRVDRVTAEDALIHAEALDGCRFVSGVGAHAGVTVVLAGVEQLRPLLHSNQQVRGTGFQVRLDFLGVEAVAQGIEMAPLVGGLFGEADFGVESRGPLRWKT